MILTLWKRKLKLRKVEVMRSPRGSTARIENQVGLISELPGGSNGKQSVCSVGDASSIPGLGRSPEEGNGNPLLFLSGKSHGERSLGGLQSVESQTVRHD